MQMWADAVEYVGPSNVLQLVSDGENTNKAAGVLLEQKYPHIQWSACVAHCLNNLLKDIGKLDWVKNVIDNGKEVVTLSRDIIFLLLCTVNLPTRSF